MSILFLTIFMAILFMVIVLIFHPLSFVFSIRLVLWGVHFPLLSLKGEEGGRGEKRVFSYSISSRIPFFFAILLMFSTA